VNQAAGGPCAPAPINFGQTLSGTLQNGDCQLPSDGSLLDTYSFNGTAGQQISILMTSTAFDSFLFLNNPDGSPLTSDDDGGGGHDSRIPATSGFISLPTTGTYTILANSFAANMTGAYSLTLTGVPLVLTEQSTSNAAALNSVTFVRGPFQILDSHNFSADGHTRIILFTSDLGLAQQQNPSSSIVSVQASGTNLPVENVGPLLGVTGLNGSYVVVMLPNGLSTGTKQLTLTLRGTTSAATTLTIVP